MISSEPEHEPTKAQQNLLRPQTEMAKPKLDDGFKLDAASGSSSEVSTDQSDVDQGPNSSNSNNNNQTMCADEIKPKANKVDTNSIDMRQPPKDKIIETDSSGSSRAHSRGEPTSDFDTIDSLYRLSSENYHQPVDDMSHINYSNAEPSKQSTQQVRMLNYFERPAHYATIARSSRFNHENSWPSEPTGDTFSNSNSNNRPNRLVGPRAQEQGIDFGQTGAMSRANRIRSKAVNYSSNSKRQHRYNTMTAVGAREFRRREALADSASELGRPTGFEGQSRHLSYMVEPQLNATRADLGESSVWSSPYAVSHRYLPDGGQNFMIPRVNASTLRRNLRLSANDTNASIAEEPSNDEELEMVL